MDSLLAEIPDQLQQACKLIKGEKPPKHILGLDAALVARLKTAGAEVESLDEHNMSVVAKYIFDVHGDFHNEDGPSMGAILDNLVVRNYRINGPDSFNAFFFACTRQAFNASTGLFRRYLHKLLKSVPTTRSNGTAEGVSDLEKSCLAYAAMNDLSSVTGVKMGAEQIKSILNNLRVNANVKRTPELSPSHHAAMIITVFDLPLTLEAFEDDTYQRIVDKGLRIKNKNDAKAFLQTYNFGNAVNDVDVNHFLKRILMTKKPGLLHLQLPL
jgi:hypothetical protein